MVTSSTIKRLADQIDALETRYRAKREHKVVFVTCGLGEDRAAAWQRHLIENPQDEDADVSIFTLYEERIPGEYELARDRAAAKQERLRAIRQGRNIALVPQKASSTEQWAAEWANTEISK